MTFRWKSRKHILSMALVENNDVLLFLIDWFPSWHNLLFGLLLTGPLILWWYRWLICQWGFYPGKVLDSPKRSERKQNSKNFSPIPFWIQATALFSTKFHCPLIVLAAKEILHSQPSSNDVVVAADFGSKLRRLFWNFLSWVCWSCGLEAFKPVWYESIGPQVLLACFVCACRLVWVNVQHLGEVHSFQKGMQVSLPAHAP